MRLVMQQGFEIPRVCELAQSGAQQFGLARDQRAVEGQVCMAGLLCWIVHTKAKRQRQIPHKGAAPCLASHQSHGLQLGIDTRCSDQCKPVLGGKFAVRGKARPGSQSACANVVRKVVHQ